MSWVGIEERCVLFVGDMGVGATVIDDCEFLIWFISGIEDGLPENVCDVGDEYVVKGNVGGVFQK